MAKEAAEAEVQDGAEEAAPEAAASKTSATKAAVLTDQGAHIRTYSKEDHGDDFHENAKEFSAHMPGSTVELS